VHQQTTLVIITELAKRGDLHRKIKKTKQRVSLRLKWEDWRHKTLLRINCVFLQK
jgi:hypothetical protein